MNLQTPKMLRRDDSQRSNARNETILTDAACGEGTIMNANTKTANVNVHTQAPELSSKSLSMNLMVALAALVSVVLIAGLTSGCELDADADVDGADGVGGDALDDSETDAVEALEYRFVRVSDQSTKTGTVNGGADIDAVLVTKRDGTQFAGQSIEGFRHGGGHFEGPDLDPMEALGYPDSFYNWPDSSRCDVDRGFVSLGGSGGYVIVGMGTAIEHGDRITVAEVGGCQWSGGTAIAEPVRVEVSVSSDLDSQWSYVGSGSGPVVSLTVPALPERFEE